MRIEVGAPIEVVIRFVRTDAFLDAELAARARALLEVPELEQLLRLRPPGARRDYLAAHALGRTMLAERAGCAPRDVRLRSTSMRKPMLVAPWDARRLRFSLSHADGIAMCAIAEDWDIGVDVESARSLGRDPLETAAVICTPSERRALRALPRAERSREFLSVWTCKEAIAKATGLGLTCPLSRVRLISSPGAPGRARLWPPTPRGARDSRDGHRVGRTVKLATLRLPPHYVASVAVLTWRHRRATFQFEEAAPKLGVPA